MLHTGVGLQVEVKVEACFTSWRQISKQLLDLTR